MTLADDRLSRSRNEAPDASRLNCPRTGIFNRIRTSMAACDSLESLREAAHISELRTAWSAGELFRTMVGNRSRKHRRLTKPIGLETELFRGLWHALPRPQKYEGGGANS
jgi:hypothetical protein